MKPGPFHPWIASLLACMCLAASPPRAGKLEVVTTIPDLADIAREIGGERVSVTSICKGRENLHRVAIKPSHLSCLARADLFVQIGLSLETSFVPGLLQACRNPAIQPGGEGFVNASDGWQAIDVPASLRRSEGDIHPQGNPHMNLHPGAGRHIAAAILAALVRVDPASADDYRRGHAAYLEQLAAAEARWEQMASRWRKAKFVPYHLQYDYLLAHYGLEVLGSIELKPGIPPTPRHLSELIARMQAERPAAILTAGWSNNRNVEEVSQRTGTPVLELPSMAGGTDRTASWIGMMDAIHEQLDSVLGSEGPRAQ